MNEVGLLVSGPTVALPDPDCDPDHPPEAEQEVGLFVEDQLSDVEPP